MELTIAQGDLAFGVGRALGSVSARSPLPLLSCLLLEASDGKLVITGTDLDVSTSVRIPCTVTTPGRIAVSARHFNEVVRKIARGPLSLAVRQQQVELKYGDGKGWSRFPTQDPSDFPRVPELKAETQLTLEPQVFGRLSERSGYAASTEETRPQLNGVLIQGTEKQVTFVATDGHRLAQATRHGSFAVLSKDGVIVPTRALHAVSRAAQDATSPVEIQVAGGRNQAAFAMNVGEYRVEIVTRLLEGPYPNYEQVVPKNNPRELICARADLAEAVDIVASHADNVTRQVRFSVRNNELGISSATELGSGEHKIAARYAGDSLDIGYNAGYLLDILKGIPTEEVTFRLNTALSAAVVEPAGALPETEEGILCLIMPLRLPDAAG
jgi:DNA polymerase III subunit beta